MKNFKEIVYKNLFEGKRKQEFPDLNNDGRITKADVLIGRGVKLKKEEAQDATEQTKPSLEEAVKTILEEEGGAADLKKIEEKLRDKNMEVPMDLEQRLADMKPNVLRHKKGDYIEMSGLKEENPDMMLPAE